MEQEIILEGIHAMLEEIRDNIKKNPELETMKSKLSAIGKVCNDLAEKKLVTEDLMVSFISYLLKQMVEINKKQDEKIEKLKECVLGHHKFVKETLCVKINFVISILEQIESYMKMRQTKSVPIFFTQIRRFLRCFY